MIVCAIEDLLFSIKIRTAAKQLGVDIHFERQGNAVLPAIREKRPSLVIFDLNSSRLAPMDVIATMKADPELKRIMTIGYVSHVDSEAIGAARQAGCDQVLARSTFAERLGAILSSSGSLRSM
jgi:CheY-like chemotaxis protein